jgi:hypothetical protein
MPALPVGVADAEAFGRFFDLPESAAAVRSFCGELPALLRAVGFRDIEDNLSCVMDG